MSTELKIVPIKCQVSRKQGLIARMAFSRTGIPLILAYTDFSLASEPETAMLSAPLVTFGTWLCGTLGADMPSSYMTTLQKYIQFNTFVRET